MKECKSPITKIRVGSTDVPVYVTRADKGDKVYTGYVAFYRVGNQRRPITRSTLQALEAEVKEVVGPFVGENDTLTRRSSLPREYERGKKVAAERLPA